MAMSCPWDVHGSTHGSTHLYDPLVLYFLNIFKNTVFELHRPFLTGGHYSLSVKLLSEHVRYKAHDSKMNQQQIQQCIRQDAEERNEALSDLTAWMDTLKVDKPSIPSNSNKDQGVVVSEGTYEEEHARGNAAFKSGDYVEAVECYSRCLKHDEALSTPDIYSNLCLSYLKQKHFSKAEHAATAALRISPCHSKSLHRRSVANLRQGKLRAALVDVCVAEEVTGGQKEEIKALKFKIENALMDATKKASRRRVTISFV